MTHAPSPRKLVSYGFRTEGPSMCLCVPDCGFARASECLCPPGVGWRRECAEEGVCVVLSVTPLGDRDSKSLHHICRWLHPFGLGCPPGSLIRIREPEV